MTGNLGDPIERWHSDDDLKAAIEIAVAAERARCQAERAGWEVEGFIDRLTRRDDTNSERLVLEAISHLRGFSRECDALREAVAAERERIATKFVVWAGVHLVPFKAAMDFAAAIREGE